MIFLKMTPKMPFFMYNFYTTYAPVWNWNSPLCTAARFQIFVAQTSKANDCYNPELNNFDKIGVSDDLKVLFNQRKINILVEEKCFSCLANARASEPMINRRNYYSVDVVEDCVICKNALRNSFFYEMNGSQINSLRNFEKLINSEINCRKRQRFV